MNPVTDYAKLKILEIIGDGDANPNIYDVWQRVVDGPDSGEKRRRFHALLVELESGGFIAPREGAQLRPWIDELQFWSVFQRTEVGGAELAQARARRTPTGWQPV